MVRMLRNWNPVHHSWEWKKAQFLSKTGVPKEIKNRTIM